MVIAIVGATLGETAIVETPVYCPDSIIGITPFWGKATPEFIEFLLRLWKTRLKELAPDAARANLNLERLRSLQVLVPSLEEQEAFSRIAKDLRALAVMQIGSNLQLTNLYSSIQQSAFRGELDLSRVALVLRDDAPPTSKPEEFPVNATRAEGAAAVFLQAPPAIEASLKQIDDIVSKGEQIAWSADYFRYRVIGACATPFSFGDVMQRADSIFEAPPYEKIKDIILELLGKGGGPASMNQRFDLHVDAEAKEVSGRKEIVFEPVP